MSSDQHPLVGENLNEETRWKKKLEETRWKKKLHYRNLRNKAYDHYLEMKDIHDHYLSEKEKSWQTAHFYFIHLGGLIVICLALLGLETLLK
jgi:hypothetical protein